MELGPPLRKKYRRNIPTQNPQFAVKEAEDYLERVDDIVFIHDADRFQRVCPTLVQRYTNGAGCYAVMQQFLNEMLFSERFCHTHDRIPDLREMLSVAITNGYHHGVVANIAVRGSRKYTGFLLFRDVFFLGLKADLVKLMFRLNMLTNRDVFILKQLVDSFGERFMEAIENIEDPEDYKSASVVVAAPEVEDLSDEDEDEDEDEDDDDDDEDNEMPELAAARAHAEYVNDCQETDDTMKFIQEAASSPRSLQDLAAMAVSRGVGHKNNRAALVEKLRVPEVLRSSIMHQEAADALRKSARFCDCDLARDRLCVCMCQCPCPCECLGGPDCVCIHKQPAE